jgi:hypothetical protein
MPISPILLFYLVALLVVLGAGVGAFWIFARYNRLLGAGLGLLLMVVLVLLWPIPIHGGFTFLGEVLYRELDRALERHQEVVRQQEKRELRQRLETRFGGPLDFSITEPLPGTWSRVLVQGGQPAWYESDSLLLWSDWLLFEPDAALPSLASAKEHCRSYPPEGHWALASEMENYLLWKSGGDQLLPDAPASSVSYLVDEQTGLELPTYNLRGYADNAGQWSSEHRVFVARCVARGPGAPPAGYARWDIPLEEWNRYQLSKLGN